ncbi:L-ascorbate metabolism protein UlaG (beta-lactamase superfamily) [Nocardioides massiliensis]|uniref:L-ascorbate metabolism protein UlaG (Beta-lactamase superfamily) n=3 Tax=Nocardioides massiliensis TaxID=1325935 RepID=A0ABT9NSE7_9ACTN|nr:MBL fold metallo-hydrolase [Nocardioides massiliensis]MDP9823231.1 L-ascorbate metabolism protein UlaG (beta-lactamase superfamily) [Nocardioides massiliensis]
MRLRLGRPDLARYAHRFGVPAANGPFAVTFLGVSTLLLDDGESAVMTDGFFSRPSLAKVGLGRIAPDHDRITAALARTSVDRLQGVLPVHTHFDHALDAAVVAERTGAVLIGGESTANIGRGGGLPEERLRVVASGESLSLGGFELTWVESDHCPPDRFPGPITEPVVPPAKAKDYRCGEAWSLLFKHTSGRTALIQGSAGYVPGALAGQRADVAYLGVGQLGLQDEDYIRAYWAETVQAVGAKSVVLIHWDDFFRPLDVPLRALPYAGDDLDETMRVLAELAADQAVELHLPTVWRREDPWASLH